ncbi:hypothetical protein HBI73_250670 [Parastagonospora nodorum]|nr:hypothetical protein HBI73_250670 [Parastagonospora nodorum]KAH5205657.1 hypothetical protein HBI62_245320 [Parastagonospora nodorum]KAH5662357.1 hypothetical protein HBI44_245100 [Parastagonospora nodorum]KAH6072119.1 hypothetical protein HBI65_250240 [Parastagonospora nodorum]KAH6134233.1 hypothetical protein HBI63_245350 [Parastagonospora nodorum]
MDTLTVTPIEDDDNLLNTIDSHIKLRKLKEVMPLCRTIKSLSIPSADKYSKKHLEVREADASKQVGANVREGGNKNRSSLYYSDSNSDTATGKTRIKARARLIERQRLESEAQLRKASEEEELAKTKKEKREKEAREREAGSDGPLDSDDYRSDSSPDIDPEDDSEDEEATTAKDLAREQKERLKALLNAKMRDSLSARNKRTMKLPARWGGYCDSTPYQLTGAYILYFKELSSDNGRIFASDTFTSRTRRKCEMPEQKGLILRRRTSTSSHNDDWLGRAADAWKNEVVAMDPANSTLCDPSDPLVVRFCIFSDPALENIGIPTNEEVVEMQTDTATALADELAAVNKSVRLQTFTLKILEHVETVHWTMAEANMPAVHPEATKHRPAPSAARFALVRGFGKVDRHVFRADNTMSVTAQRTITRKGILQVETNAILLPGHVTVWGRTVFDEFHNCKSEGTIMAKFYKDLRKYN